MCSPPPPSPLSTANYDGGERSRDERSRCEQQFCRTVADCNRLQVTRMAIKQMRLGYVESDSFRAGAADAVLICALKVVKVGTEVRVPVIPEPGVAAHAGPLKGAAEIIFKNGGTGDPL